MKIIKTALFILIPILNISAKEVKFIIEKTALISIPLYDPSADFSYMLVIQDTTTIKDTLAISILQDKDWVMQFPSKKEYSCELRFTKDERIMAFTFEGESSIDKHFYYLSDTIPEKFDRQMVGHSRKGKYIISYNSKGGMRVHEILTLTKTDLCIKYIPPEGEIIIGNGPACFKSK